MTPDELDLEPELARLARRPYPEAGEDAAWAKLRAATVEAGPEAAPRASGNYRRIRQWGLALGAAAAVMVAMLLERSFPSGVSTSTQTYATHAGQRAMVALRDGSRAMLGPATTLVVATDDANAGTTATITGEAFFTVTHHGGRVFSVRTPHAIARVLGTSFVVRRYATDHATQVVVVDGRVAVQPASGTTAPGGRAFRPSSLQVLTASMTSTITDSGHVAVIPNIAVDDYTSWTNGRLVFKSIPAREVVTELSRAYNVEFRITDSALATTPLTWTVPTNTASLTVVLDELSDMLNARVKRTGHIVTIARGRPSSHSNMPARFPLTQEPQYGR